MINVLIGACGSALAGVGAVLIKKGETVWKESSGKGKLFVAAALMLSLSGSIIFLYALSRGKASVIGLAGTMIYPAQIITAVVYLKEHLTPGQMAGTLFILTGIIIAAAGGAI